MTERELLQETLEHAAAQPGIRLFRCNNGRFRTLAGGRIIHGGINGAPDLLGWQHWLVEPEDVGRLMPIFTGIELKARRGRLRPEQAACLHRMELAGCHAGVARSIDGVARILTQRPGLIP